MILTDETKDIMGVINTLENSRNEKEKWKWNQMSP